jgi:hypothetical protein
MLLVTTEGGAVNATNASVVRKGYDDFANGDIPAVLEAFDTSITWHLQVHSPLSGDYKGHDEVIRFNKAVFSLIGNDLCR